MTLLILVTLSSYDALESGHQAKENVTSDIFLLNSGEL